MALSRRPPVFPSPARSPGRSNIVNGGTTTLANCTVSGNSADRGGGIFNNYSGTTTLANCTFSGNSSSTRGGIYHHYGTLTVTNCTASGNSAGGFGGIFSENGGTTTLANTIIATNTARTGADIYGSVTSKGYNLIGNSSNEGGFVATDLLNLNPLLGPLQKNGGPTETMALPDGSQAIATGSVALIPAGITTDQRGSPRVVNGMVDIGAFESGLAPATPTIILELVVTTQTTDKKGKPVGKPVLVGFALEYRTAMDRPTVARHVNYGVYWTIDKQVRKIVKFTAAYNQSTNSVTLTVKGKPTFATGGGITVNASPPNGVSSTAGVPLDSSDTDFTILPKAKGIRPA